jgi:N-acetyltransferase
MVLMSNCEISMLQIRPSDSYELRQKLKRIESIVDNDLGFIVSNGHSSRQTAYLFVRGKKVLGVAIAETVTTAFKLKSCLERSNEGRKAMVGIKKIWVHHKCRNQGIASILVDVVRSKFIYGLNVPVQMLAFSSPTLAGMNFARRYVNSACGDKVSEVLVYDCS